METAEYNQKLPKPNLTKLGIKKPAKTFFIYYLQNNKMIQVGCEYNNWAYCNGVLKKLKASGNYNLRELKMMEKNNMGKQLIKIAFNLLNF